MSPVRAVSRLLLRQVAFSLAAEAVPSGSLHKHAMQSTKEWCKLCRKTQSCHRHEVSQL